MAWTYNPNDYEERDFTPLAAGDYRVRIDEVIEKTFKTGNSGFEITLSVSGKNHKLWHYIVFMHDNPKLTNQKLGELFKCFGITDTDLDKFYTWIGKVGACRVKQEVNQQTGEISSKIHYLIMPDKATNLPAWVEPQNGLLAGDNTTVSDMPVPW